MAQVEGDIEHHASSATVEAPAGSVPVPSTEGLHVYAQPMDAAQAEMLWKKARAGLKAFDSLHIRLQRGSKVLYIDIAKGVTP